MNSKNIMCDQCENCIYVGAGDMLCDMLDELVMSGFSPTDNYLGCNGEDYRERGSLQ